MEKSAKTNKRGDNKGPANDKWKDWMSVRMGVSIACRAPGILGLDGRGVRPLGWFGWGPLSAGLGTGSPKSIFVLRRSGGCGVCQATAICCSTSGIALLP